MTQSKMWPEKALVGYVTAYVGAPKKTTNLMISEALSHKYTVFVYAFGVINTNNEVSIPDGVTETELQVQIENIHKNNGLALISFGGGGVNTFTPGSDASKAALETVKFCQKYQFDGIDLDFENITVDVDYLQSYIDEFRKHNNELFITAAPQIGSDEEGKAIFQPKNIFTEFFLDSAALSAVFVQEYNQRGGAVFDGLQDTNVGFISASYTPLTKLVPKNTKIIIGEPATMAAAPAGGLFNPEDVVKDIQQGEVVLNSSQYGGIMVWAINYDSEQNWSFADGVQSVI